MKKQFLEVGEVVAVHGLRGDMRLYPWCDPGDIERSMRMYLDEKGEQEYRVSYAKPHKNVYLVKFKGIDNPEDARKFIGKVLYMNRNDIPMKAGDYFEGDYSAENIKRMKSGLAPQYDEGAGLYSMELHHMLVR